MSMIYSPYDKSDIHVFNTEHLLRSQNKYDNLITGCSQKKKKKKKCH